jgi:hypothetical protein
VCGFCAQVSLLSTVLYNALTTGNGTPTLGEEYSDLHAVRALCTGGVRRAARLTLRDFVGVAGGGRGAAAAVAAAARAADCAAVGGAVLAGARAVRLAPPLLRQRASADVLCLRSRRALRHPVSAEAEGSASQTAAGDEHLASSGALAGARDAAAAASTRAAAAIARARALLRRAMPHMEARGCIPACARKRRP